MRSNDYGISIRIRAIAPAQAEVMDRGRLFFRALASLATEARWTQSPQVMSVALHLVTQDATKATTLLTALRETL
jgi:hypothetical protein